MDALGHPSRVLLVGGTSEIGLAIVDALTDGRPTELVTAGRDRDRCLDAAAGMSGAVRHVPFDAMVSSGGAVVEEAWRDGDVDLVVVAHGMLGDADDRWDPDRARQTFVVNCTSAIEVLAAVADRVRHQGHGTIVVLSSVAAARPRRSNFVYGAAKAGLDAFAVGMTEDVEEAGGRVVVVRPGFVRTRMTAHLSDAPMATTPDDVGAAVAAGVRQGRRVVWAPKQMRLVAAAMQVLPEPVFRVVARRADAR